MRRCEGECGFMASPNPQSNDGTKYRIRCHRLNLAWIKFSFVANRTLCQPGSEGPGCRRKVLWVVLAMVGMETQ